MIQIIGGNKMEEEKHGDDKWKEIRNEWVKGKENFVFKPKHVNIEGVVETMLNEEEGSFEKPIPLNDLVEILNEMWESEGIFD